MATHTVKQSGGDFSTLASACADAGTVDDDIISIEGTWSVNDTANVTISDDLTITADADSKCDPTNLASPTHYRVRDNASRVILAQAGSSGTTIDGVEIQQSGTAASAEGIRLGGGILDVNNCVIWAASQNAQQDGIYLETNNTTINAENCIVFNFYRCGIHLQNWSGTRTLTANINSCTCCLNGGGNGTVAEGNIGVQVHEWASTITTNIFNTNACGHVTSSNADCFSQKIDVGSISWDIHNCIDSDGSITDRDSGAVGALENRTLRDATAGGDEVLVNDITGSVPWDLTLIDDATNNDAQEMHSTSSGAGMSMPSTDIMGNTRSAPYSCGAFHVVAAVAGTSPPPRRYSLNHLLTR